MRADKYNSIDIFFLVVVGILAVVNGTLAIFYNLWHWVAVAGCLVTMGICVYFTEKRIADCKRHGALAEPLTFISGDPNHAKMQKLWGGDCLDKDGAGEKSSDRLKA